MKRLLIFLLLVLSSSLGAAQPIQRNYYTTNASPALPVWTNDASVIHPNIATQFKVDLSVTNQPYVILSDNASGYATNAVKSQALAGNAYMSINSEVPDSSQGTFIGLSATPTFAYVALTDENVNWMYIQPWIADATNAIAYKLSSAVPLTNSGALIMAVQD